jgi:hypothetical protein
MVDGSVIRVVSALPCLVVEHVASGANNFSSLSGIGEDRKPAYWVLSFVFNSLVNELMNQ